MKCFIRLLRFSFLAGLLVYSQARAECPDDLAIRLYNYLKLKIQWVDVNAAPGSHVMTIRYYPCYDSVSIIDTLLRQALAQEAPECKLQNPGTPVKVDGYCALQDVEAQ